MVAVNCGPGGFFRVHGIPAPEIVPQPGSTDPRVGLHESDA
jgi:hypothetical protein